MERTPEEIIKEKLDGHMGFCVLDYIGKSGSLVKAEPSDRNVNTKEYYLAKKGYEHAAMAKRAEEMQHMFMDVLALRKAELFDKDEMPIYKLADLTIKALPKQLDVKGKMDFGFMSLYNDIDVDGESK